MFTERQLYLIGALKKYGYGWKNFAQSVENSGWCSVKQESTMESMLSKVNLQKCLAEQRKTKMSSAYNPDISDCEAMRSGDFF